MKPKKIELPDEVMRLMPLTPAVFFILFALADGKFRMGPGTLYTTIQRLLELELIEEVAGDDDADSRRRYYRLTWQGRALLEREISRLEAVLRLAGEKKLWPNLAK